MVVAFPTIAALPRTRSRRVGWSQRRSALAPYASHVSIAALMRGDLRIGELKLAGWRARGVPFDFEQTEKRYSGRGSKLL